MRACGSALCLVVGLACAVQAQSQPSPDVVFWSSHVSSPVILASPHTTVDTHGWPGTGQAKPCSMASHVPVHPSPAVLDTCRHRLREKEFLAKHGFPVAPYRAVRAPALAIYAVIDAVSQLEPWQRTDRAHAAGLQEAIRGSEFVQGGKGL